VSILHVELFENCGDEGILGENDAGNVFLTVDLMPMNWRARPGLMIWNLSRSLPFTSFAAMVASYGYNIEMSPTYKSITISLLRRWSVGSTWYFVNLSESKKVLISLCQSCGARLKP